MTKSMRKSMFNEPMSVRGIKRIEIEEDEKNARMQEKHEKVQDEQEQEQEEPQEPSLAAPTPIGAKAKHKLTLTNIVEEEISPTSKSSASILGKPKGTKAPQANMSESNDPTRKFENTQGISTADDKELLEE